MKAKFWKSLSLLGTLSFLIVVVSAHASGVSTTDVTHCGTLSGSETWRAGDNVHIVSCDVTIPEGVTLRIEPGAIIKMKGYSSITVHGKLIARGDNNNPIYFTSYRDDTIGGDVNGDGTLNVLDVVQLVNMILSGGDISPASDVNGDGALNVLDIVQLVNLILS